MKKVTSKTVFDWMVIILEMSYGISILMEVFHLIPSLGYLFPLLAFMIVAHFIRFKTNFCFIKEAFRNPIFLLFFLILFLDLIQAFVIIRDGPSTRIAFVRLLNSFVFLSYLYNLYKEKKSVYLILKPYIGYSLYNVITMVFLAILIIVGFPWQINQLSGDIGLLTEDIEGGGIYYFPYYLSIASDYHPIRIFSSLPGLSGLSHEPHVIMMIITPALIIALASEIKLKWKFLFIGMFIFVLMQAMSTTAIVCVLVILFVQTLWMALFSHGWKYFILFSALISIFLYFASDYLDLIYLQAGSKMESSGSKDVSSNMLSYLFSFNDILAHGNIPPEMDEFKSKESAGVLTGVLDITLYAIMFLFSAKFTFLRDKNRHYLGLGYMYFLLHGLKVSYLLFGYPWFYYLLFVMVMANKSKKLKVSP